MRLLRALCFAALATISIPTISNAAVAIGVSITVAPPALPAYAQPPIPADGYLWQPGYWAYGPGGYYWVPGTWVLPPEPGVLWTPAYWGWDNGVYLFHAGYWGPHVGFYGGINYGFGYFGTGFEGGRWDHGVFSYNRAVTNIRSVHVTNIYSKTVVHESVSRVSYNGGPHGIETHPSSREERYSHEQHSPATSIQAQHEHAASTNRSFLASTNHGRPAIPATSRPGQFHNVSQPRHGPAPSAPHNAPAMHAAPQAGPEVHHGGPPAGHAPPQGGGGPQHEQHGGPPDQHDDHHDDHH
jgi:hypothetical protein